MTTGEPAPLQPSTFDLRPADAADVPSLRTLISNSVLALHSPYYTPNVISLSLRFIYVINTTLLNDGNYFLISTHDPEPVLVGCSAYSHRKKNDELLDPERDAAILKALYVHPDAGRKGVGRQLLKACENAAKERGFKRMEMGATFAGKKFYLKEGYAVLRDEEGKEMRDERGLGEGEKLELVRMGRDLV